MAPRQVEPAAGSIGSAGRHHKKTSCVPPIFNLRGIPPPDIPTVAEAVEGRPLCVEREGALCLRGYWPAQGTSRLGQGLLAAAYSSAAFTSMGRTLSTIGGNQSDTFSQPSPVHCCT